MKQIDQRAMSAVSDAKEKFEALVESGTALEGTFEFTIRKRDKRERNVSWSWKENTPDGLMLKMGRQDVLVFS